MTTHYNYNQGVKQPRYSVKYIQQSKVRHFTTLYDRLVTKLGNKTKANRACGLTSHVVAKMDDKELNDVNAKKILTTYNKYFK